MTEEHITKRFRDMEVAFSIWKTVFGFVLSLVVAVVGWSLIQSYAFADEYAVLKNTVVHHEKLIPTNTSRIEDLSKDVNAMKVNIAVSKIRLDDIYNTTQQIRELLNNRFASIPVTKDKGVTKRRK